MRILGNPTTDGYRHGQITLWLTPIGFLSGLVIGILGYTEALPTALSALAGMVGCLLGLFIDPDLDQEWQTTSEWRVINLLKGTRFHWVSRAIGAVWSAYWMPYALFTKHRGISHTPVIGTLTRVGYLAVPVVVAALLLSFDIRSVSYDAIIFMVAILVGLMISDLGHWARDFLGLGGPVTKEE
jgi:uncharacterized metal-binding protein